MEQPQQNDIKMMLDKINEDADENVLESFMQCELQPEANKKQHYGTLEVVDRMANSKRFKNIFQN